MLDLVINPTAGGQKGKKMEKTLKTIEERLKERNVEYKVHLSKEKNHLTELTKNAIKNGATCIVAMGGDGTLHEIINGFSDFERVSLGIIPCGTGNDFASALNLPFAPKDAIDLIIDGEAKYTDFMQMPTVRGLNIIGTGMDVEVLKRYNDLKKKTKFGYTKCLLKTLFKFKPMEFNADFNGESRLYRSFTACIANGDRYGGGLKICPIADPSDEYLDFIAVNKMSKLKLIFAFAKLKKGKIMDIREATHERMQEVKILTKGDYVVNVDGELYENIPFEVKIVSNTLRVFR